MHNHPYQGLSPYAIADAPRFYGRKQAVCKLQAQLQARIAQNIPLVIVTGAAGCGKTSLLQAGIAAAPSSEQVSRRVARMQPGENPEDLLSGLGQSLLRCLPELQAQKSATPAALADLLTVHPLALELLLNNALELAAESENKTVEIVILIDPLEEIFLDSVWHEQRIQWFKGLHNLLSHPHIQVLAALRQEFVPRCNEYPELQAWMSNGGIYAMPKPNADELQEIICEPAIQSGLRFAQQNGVGLEQTLIEDALRLNGDLSQLQYGLIELCRQANSEMLSPAHYAATGGLGQSLEQRMRAIFNQLAQPAQIAWPDVISSLSHFTHVDEYCIAQRVPQQTLQRTPAWKSVSQALEAAALLQRDLHSDKMYLPYAALSAALSVNRKQTQATGEPESVSRRSDSASSTHKLPQRTFFRAVTPWLWPAFTAVLVAGVLYTGERWQRAERLLQAAKLADIPLPLLVSEAPTEVSIVEPVPKRPGLVADLEALGEQLRAQKNPLEALIFYRQAIRLRQQEGEHGWTEVMRAELATAYRATAQLNSELNLLEQAMDARKLAAAQWEKLLAENPNHLTWLHDAALNGKQLAHTLRTAGQAKSAMQANEQAISYAKQLAQRDESPNHQRLLAYLYDFQGDLHQADQALSKAQSAYQKALEIRLALAKQQNTQQAQQEVFYSYYKLRTLKK